MEKNSFLSFNSHRYEEHLSLFGKKVLHVMIKHWNTGVGRSFNKPAYDEVPHEPDYSNRVLNFSDSSCCIANTPSVTDPIDAHMNVTLGKTPKSNMTKNNLKEIPKSTELVKTVKPNTEIDFNNSCRNDAIHPVYTNMDIEYNIHNVVADDGQNNIYQKNKTSIGYSNKIKQSNIAWNDMFDTELLTVAQSNADREYSHSQYLKMNIPDKNTSNVEIINEKNNDNFKDYFKAFAEETDNKKTIKCKSQYNISDTVAKKVKNIVVNKPKNNVRKLKYTKVVKNWLNDVNPANSIEEDETENICKNKSAASAELLCTKNSDGDTTDLKFHAENNINTKIAKGKTKKVVQAQLANKDGVMKFSKPKSHGGKKTLNEHDTKNMPATENIKDKKAKPKFVTPVKSQLPVKEITYDISITDASNFEIFKNEMFKSNNEEIAVVLVYSNGFSQLNSHYTDDSCIPEGILINIDHKFFYFKGSEETVLSIIVQILKQNKIICYQGKNVLIYLQNMSVLHLDVHQLQMMDAKIGGSLLDPDNPPEDFSQLQELLNFTPQYTIATTCVLQKSAWYMTLLKECVFILNIMLVENSLWKVFVDIEMKLLPIIADMERRGVAVDIEKLRSMEDILIKKMKAVELDCYKTAGKTFQINSTVQVRAILYDELHLDTKCNVKIKETISKGAKSTSESMLRSLITVHPLPKLILEYRHLHKAHATFLTGIAQHVKDGIVRPTWVQTAAATGRIASNNPNLQAIPKTPFSLVMFPEAQENDEYQLRFRSLYTARGGHALLAADFKHVECRVLARVAADTALLHALAPHRDLFRALAAQWLHKPEGDVSSEERERTKRMVYASVYGAGARKLMEILGITYEQTLALIASFNRTFPCLKTFGRSVVSQCEQNGGRLSTLCGRVRYFKHIASDDFALRSHAERQAVNFIVQGSAADICKVAMIRTEQRLRGSSPPVGARLVLQIHDELVWEVQHHHLDTAAAIIKQVMENCGYECGMSMSLPVAMSFGNSWGDMAEYTPGK